MFQNRCENVGLHTIQVGIDFDKLTSPGALRSRQILRGTDIVGYQLQNNSGTLFVPEYGIARGRLTAEKGSEALRSRNKRSTSESNGPSKLSGVAP